MFYKLTSNKKTHRKKNSHITNKSVYGGTYTLKKSILSNSPNDLLILTKELFETIIEKLCYNFELNNRLTRDMAIHNLKKELCLAIFIKSLGIPDTIKIYKDTYEYTRHSYIDYFSRKKNFSDENWNLFEKIINIYEDLVISIEKI